MEDITIDFSSSDKIEETLNKVDELMTQLNEQQANYGTAQNILKTSLSGLTTREENTTSAKSTISDCDIAEESSKYMQQQILEQTCAVLLTQANSSSLIALDLINGK